MNLECTRGRVSNSHLLMSEPIAASATGAPSKSVPRAAITNGLARNKKLNCEGHTFQGMGIKHGLAVQLMPSLVHTIHTPGVHAPIRLRPVEVDYGLARQCEYPGQGLMKLKHQGMQCETVCDTALMWTSPVQPLHCEGCCAEQAGRKAQGEHSHADPTPCQQPRPTNRVCGSTWL